MEAICQRNMVVAHPLDRGLFLLHTSWKTSLVILLFDSKFQARCRHFPSWSIKTLSTLEHLSSTAAEWSANYHTWLLRSSINLVIIPLQESSTTCKLVAGKSFTNTLTAEFCKRTIGTTTTGDKSGLFSLLISLIFCPHLSNISNVKAIYKSSFTFDIYSL